MRRPIHPTEAVDGGTERQDGQDQHLRPETDDAWRAIEVVFRSHYPTLLAVAAPYGGPGTGAADIVQEAMIVAHDNFGKLRNPAKALPWLKQITTNVGKRVAEKRMRRAERFEERVARQVPEPAAPRSIAEEVFRLRVEKAVDELPGLQGKAFRRRVREEMRVTEIAEDLGCPLGTVKINLHRARTALRAKLGDDYRALTGLEPK